MPMNSIHGLAAEIAAACSGEFAFGAGVADSARLTTLAPVACAAQVSGVGDTTGIALVEIYEVP